MYNLILVIHFAICVFVILIVLIQAGRSGGFSGLMGGGGGDAIFSTSSQQSGLRKATVIMAGIFMATSLFLTILSSRINRTNVSVMNRPLRIPALPAAAQPEQPVAPPVAPNPAPLQKQPASAEPVKK